VVVREILRESEEDYPQVTQMGKVQNAKREMPVVIASHLFGEAISALDA